MSADGRSIEERLVWLEGEVGRLGDHLAISRLIAAYGPAVDTLDGSGVAALWTENGAYETAGQTFAGAEGLAAVVDHPHHQALVSVGCGHVNSAPLIVLDGDRATARSYSRVYRRAGGAWVVERASANLWSLVRTAEGWRVAHRVNRLLDGSVGGRALLAQPADLAPSASSTDPDTYKASSEAR